MPPRPKFSRDDIVNAALAVVSKKGVAALTAREVANELGCSTRPIFTMFEDMDELKAEVRSLAARSIHKSTADALVRENSFIAAEIRAIHIAMEHPNVYQLVFLTGGDDIDALDELLTATSLSAGEYAAFMQEAYGLEPDESRTLFCHAWIYTLGIGTLCATRSYKFTEEELERMLVSDFWAMHAYIKGGCPKEGGFVPLFA